MNFSAKNRRIWGQQKEPDTGDVLKLVSAVALYHDPVPHTGWATIPLMVTVAASPLAGRYLFAAFSAILVFTMLWGKIMSGIHSLALSMDFIKYGPRRPCLAEIGPRFVRLQGTGLTCRYAQIPLFLPV